MSVNDPRIGTRIGGYEIESFLGRGGMGVVYKARHLRLGRMVALKILAPELAADENFRTRFVRESEIAASIDHPNVIPVYDADEIDGTLFLAMRFVDGTDLKKVIEESGPLDTERTISVIEAVGGALDSAHALGLIHRDIKPGNVLVGRTESGPEHIYLTDFGLTKHGSSKSGLTATGAFVGTIDYISPEQIEGKPVDARTDIYALGCVLFECLTGEVPFKKDEEVAVMYAHLMDERPKVSARNPSLPAAVDSVVDRAMARDPESRYASGEELTDDLRASLGVAPTPTPNERVITAERPEQIPNAAVKEPGKRLSPTLIAGALAGLVVLAGAIYFLTRGGDEQKNQQAGTVVPADAVYVSPDGSSGGVGSKAEPLSSLKVAVQQAGAGGTVVVGDGVYQSDAVPMLTIKDPITIMGAEGAAPVLRGSDRFADGIRIAAGTSEVAISNLVFEDFKGEALKIFCVMCKDAIENEDITLDNLEFTTGGTPITVENVAGLNLDGVNVHDNAFTGFICSPGPCDQVTIRNSGFESSSHRFGEGFRLERGDDLIVETSTFSGNPGNGLYSLAETTHVARSRFEDNGDVGAWLVGAETQITDSIVAHNGQESAGLIMGPADCKTCSGPGSISVANVLVAQNAVGISAEASKDDDVTLQMFNSIVSGNDGTGLRVIGPIDIERLDHDLFETTGRWLAVSWRGEGYSTADLDSGSIPVPNSSGTFGSGPEFASSGDYHLTPSSAGVDQGTPEGVTSELDLDGNARVQGAEIDIGPYEQ